MKKKLLFRVDAGDRVGLGHYYRSYNLALALKREGYLVVFIHKLSSFWAHLKLLEFDHITLSDSNSNNEMILYCKQENFWGLYVDGIIDFQEKDINLLKGIQVIFYQNLSNSRHFADVFILPSIHQNASFFKNFDKKRTQIYQGLEYFTFNAKLNQCNSKELTIDHEINNIGIICSGSDPKNVMISIYDLIDFERWPNIFFNFYVGVNYLFEATIPQDSPINVKFVSYDLIKIASNDLLISSFGLSTYEFMSLGMPIISLGHQKTNTFASEYLAKKTDALIHLGFIDDISSEAINHSIKTLLDDKKLIINFSKKAKKLLDNKGIERIIEIINKL